ncbi:hypothetical protein GCM10011351_17260 [Paraliobacillus quinghaiensis]|uniref:Uncharacterized protein n=1 Tax=Paraliobacillus quinghaiensis TaxID=470815 RepID=A0A917TPC2_9BACI|nr:hypothetical protein [Paraliobacillus quinghaiensis]GGM31633.1 hypothetical protein GCM10011351_17260 [Paraliobacillus quinghaiensis]
MKGKRVKQTGFVLSELLVSLSLIMMVSFTLVPIIFQLNMEQHILFQHREVQSQLHNELQTFSNTTPKEPSYFEKDIKINNTVVMIIFEKEDLLWKGCATWINVKYKKEKTCLYYYPSK